MAIQTQGFQFQNLARYTPVDPTLVGVDFSRIGSGIADAMKLGSSLQQYQMRKQAMEEEQATRESRIAQANAAAKYLAAQANAQLAADIATKEAAAKAAKFEAEVPVAQLAGKTATGELGLLPSTLEAKRLGTQLNIGQLTQNLSLLPREGILKSAKLDLEQNITDFKKNNADLINTLGLTEDQLKVSYLQQNIQRAEAAGLQDLASAYKALMPAPPKVPNYVGMINALDRQIQEQEKKVVVDAEGNKTNLETYIATVGEPGTQKTSGLIFKTPVKRDERLDKEWTDLQRLKGQRNSLINAQLGAFQFGAGGGAGGGGGGGGMAVNVPTLGGQAQAGTPYLDNLSARIQQALGERLGGGVAQTAQVAQGAQVSQAPAISPPVLEDLINASVTTPTEGVVRMPTAAPETRAAAPAATFVIGKDGKVTREKGVVETTKELVKDYGTEAATALALLPGKETKETIKNIASRAALRGEALARLFGPKIAEGAAQATKGLVRSVKPAAAVNLADIYIGKYLGDKGQGMRASEAIGAALATDQQADIREERIAGILDQIDNVLRSNLSRDEKLSRARELQGRINEIRAASSGSNELARLVPSASGGKALILPGITSIRPGSDAEELTGPLTESDRVIPELSGPLTESDRIVPTYGDLLRRFFYGKTLDERINSKFYSGR